MADRTTICNMALSRIGVSQFIGNITENSNEARVCRVFFDPMRDFALRDQDYNFSRRRVALGLLTGTVPGMWTYKYAFPSTCVMARAIVDPTWPSGVRLPVKSQRIPYELGNEEGDQGDRIVIYTDQINAELIFSHRVTDTSLFDPVFTSGFSYLLGSEAAMPLSVKPEIAQKALDAYVRVSGRAATLTRIESEEAVESEPEPEAIAYRNG